MATDPIVRDSLYIDGGWVPSAGSGTIEVIDSTTEAVMGTVPEGTVDDVDRAVAAARAAFPAWSALPVAERTALLTKVAEALGAQMEPLGDLITHEVGMPRVLSQLVQVGLPINSFATAAQVAADFTWEQTVGNSLVVREPIGVVGCITPGTTRSTRSPPRWLLRSPPDAPWWSSPVRSPRSTPSSWPTSSTPPVSPPGVFNLVTGLRPGGGGGHRRAPGRRHGVLHRLDPGRKAGDGGGRGHREAGGHGAGREVRQRDPARCRSGDRGPRRRGQVLHELRPDVQRA